MSKSKSLAETMEYAKIAIEDASKIVIDRADNVSRNQAMPSSSSSRKRRKSSIGTDSHLSQTILDNSTDYESFGNTPEWRDKLIALVRERDEEMNDLHKQLEISELEGEKLQDLNKILEEKLISATTLASATEIRNGITSHDPNPTKMLENIIQVYEKLTCVTVKADDSEDSYICTVKNHMKRCGIKFRLGSVMSKEITFTPVANIEHFPEYLHDEIVFESAMAPVMMGDILQSLYEEKQPTEE